MIRIYSVAIPSRILTLFAGEVLLVPACYFAAVWADPDIADMDGFLRFDSGAIRILIVVACILLGSYFRDLYAQVRIRNRIALVQELFMIFGVAFVLQGLINYLNHDLTLPRKVMMLGSLLALICTVSWRLLISAAAIDSAPSGKLLFLGMSPTIARIADHLRVHPELGLAPAGYLDDHESLSYSANLERIGTLADLDQAVEAAQPQSIVIGHRENVKPWWADEFLELYFGGIHTEEASALYEKAFGRVCASEVRPRDLIFGSVFEPTPLDLNAQKLYSMGLAIVATIALLPVFAVVAALLKMRSREPLLVREPRIGLRGVPFMMISFRELSNSGALFKTALLKRASLHALPRLFNVMKGEMALVGPEPERPQFAARLAAEIPFYPQRQQVRPGLTGWEQLHRNAVKLPDTVTSFEYDLYYVKHLSLSLDSIVLLLALRKLLFGELAAV